MDLLTFLRSLAPDQREPFAIACGTTYARVRQVAYGADPASPELCVAIDRESKGAVSYSTVNDRWQERSGSTDGKKRIPMDWAYVERKIAAKA